MVEELKHLVINVVSDHSFQEVHLLQITMMLQFLKLNLKSIHLLNQRGNITLVKDQDNYGYVQDASETSYTYDGEHIQLGMWGGDWNFSCRKY